MAKPVLSRLSTGLVGQSECRGGHHRKKRREYEENTSAPPNHLAGSWLALGFAQAVPSGSPPNCYLESSGIPGKMFSARAETHSFHFLSSILYLLGLRRSRVVSLPGFQDTLATSQDGGVSPSWSAPAQSEFLHPGDGFFQVADQHGSFGSSESQ